LVGNHKSHYCPEGTIAPRMRRAQQRKQGRAALLAANPFCVYCGGTRRATTVDHMPPRMMFRGKLRPGQFEFPCCDPCNQGTKASDLVVAFLGRVYPDPTSAADQADIRRILAGLKNNMPAVLQEMHVGRAGQKLARNRTRAFLDESGGFLRLGGPLMSKHLDTFGCKLALAMHWEITKKIIPPIGGVAVRVYTNVEALERKIPDDLLRLLPGPQTLRQGTWDVTDQFEYSARTTDDHQMGIFFASFRFSFAVTAVTTMDRRLIPEKIRPVFAPAELWTPTPRLQSHC
jgi:hypothetical protein